MSSPLKVPGIIKCREPNDNIIRPIKISDNPSDPTIIPWTCPGTSALDSLSLVREIITTTSPDGTTTTIAVVTIKRATVIIAIARYYLSTTSQFSLPQASVQRPENSPFISSIIEYPREAAHEIYLWNEIDLEYGIALFNKFEYLVGSYIEKDEQGQTNGIIGASLDTSVTVSNGVISLNSNIESFNDNSIEIPAITMRLQTDLRGNNLDEAAFNVFDRISYCSNYPPTCHRSDRCINTVSDKRTSGCPIVKIPQDQIKMTEYSKSPLAFNKVVRGRGCTLKEKATNINDTGLSVKQFMLRICVYGMLKYILARMMTGKFRLKWLLNRNEHEFFNKLRENRLCRFIDAFNDPTIRGYGKYFR